MHKSLPTRPPPPLSSSSLSPLALSTQKEELDGEVGHVPIMNTFAQE